MFPRGYAVKVPPAGVRIEGGEHVKDCMKYNPQFKGSYVQSLYRHHSLGDPEKRIRTPGVDDPELPANYVYGVKSDPSNGSVQTCVKVEPEHKTGAYDHLMDRKEAQYHRSKHKLGQVPDGVAVISPELHARGFGVRTVYGEPAGSVIHDSDMDIPLDPRLGTGYQTRRNYDWEKSNINLKLHTFGIRGEDRIDHVTELMNMKEDTPIVPTPVDRYNHNQIVPDPDPLDMKTGLLRRTMNAEQLHGTYDPAQLPPAGVSTATPEFTVGDTFAGMGLMTARGPVNDIKDTKEWHIYDDLTHGVKTKPNPFPNPLRGPGRYVDFGLSDEDFLLLRDRAHIVPVMVRALALTEQEANDIFDRVSMRHRREKISVAEFHAELNSMRNGNV